MDHPLDLAVLPAVLAIARLPADAPLPAWALAAPPLVSMTRSEDELSIICHNELVAGDVEATRGWRAIRVDIAHDLEVVGITAALTGTLAGAGLSLCVIGTFDTEHVLIAEEALADACACRSRRFHRRRQTSPGTTASRPSPTRPPAACWQHARPHRPVAPSVYNALRVVDRRGEHA